ncbi:MAG TPA: Glu/Leu/Phe/Val dehydrogenase family protein [Myxococcota bacterium]|nr:Glu/Leu/Phe/Val dehydrogenase family protein [Myxococcota bacterium]
MFDPSTPSLFDPLIAEGLTTLQLRHDWRSGDTCALAGRQWDSGRRFARYGRDFDHETLPARGVQLDAEATLELYRQRGCLEPLERAFELLRQGRHQGVDCWLHGETRVLSNMHSNAMGLDNGRHALRAGGIRRHDPSDPEEEVLVDGLNLARAMSFKNVGANIPYGGSKICVHAAPVPLDDLETLGFLAWCITRSRCFTGPDMGFSPEHADVLREHFTRHIVGGPGGALGPTGGPTAEGVLLALREAARHHLGRPLREASVAVQGLGAVGGPLARLLLAEGVTRLLVADADTERIRSFVETPAEVLEPGQILSSEVDIVSPNAVGSVLGPEEIDRLRCRIVMGAANNQLRASSREGELELAERLAERGILYQVDWVHNGAGVLAGREEWEHRQEASMDRVREQLAQVCGQGVRQNLEAAREAGVTPTAMAYRRAEGLIYRRDA